MFCCLTAAIWVEQPPIEDEAQVYVAPLSMMNHGFRIQASNCILHFNKSTLAGDAVDLRECLYLKNASPQHVTLSGIETN